MLQFDQLSYWEIKALTSRIDYAIIGGGIVGSAAALRLRQLHPDARIVILERGYIPTGASTKNAGFACFGSVTELLDDLSATDSDTVWSTVAMRWKGLQRLKERFSGMDIGLKFRGSWDLIAEKDRSVLNEYRGQLPVLNAKIEQITGEKNCFSYDTTIAETAGFRRIHGGFLNRLEGELDTGKLLLATNHLLSNAGIICLNGIEVLQLEPGQESVDIHTNFGILKAGKIAVTVNGFAEKLTGDKRIAPARAQVLITEQIEGFELPGTFHYDQGYFYFRSIDNRLLLGGGRNLDFSGETTTSFGQTPHIGNALEQLLQEVILPGRNIRIAHRWSGIMGIGAEKKPLIELLHPRIGMAVRMGGMGVAIGSVAGEELAGLLTD